MSTNVPESIANADLSPAAEKVLQNNVNAQVVEGAQGVAADDLETTKQTLFVFTLDASGSMSSVQDDVIKGYNDMIDALKKSKARESILVSTWVFSDTARLLHEYKALADVPQLDRSVYNPDGGTALFPAMLNAITTEVAYGQSLRDKGIRTPQIVNVGMSDGQNNVGSVTAGQVATVIKELLGKEIYIFAFVAFGNDAKGAANQMGIPKQNVFETGASGHDIRSALGQVSQSSIKIAQTGKQGNGFFS